MDLNSLIQLKRERFEQLEREISDPRLFDNRKRAEEIMREHANLKDLLEKSRALETARKQLDDNRELATSRDVEIAAMADDEIPELEKRVSDLERDVQIALVPADQTEERDAIVEIRAGTGGNEAAIFAADLYRMYHRYAEAAGLKTEDLESSPSELGGVQGSDLSSFGRIGLSKASLRERCAPRATRACHRGSGPHSYVHSNRGGVAGGGRYRR